MGKVTEINKVLLLNPFSYDGKTRKISMDLVISRHAGQETKTGTDFPFGLAYIASTLQKEGIQFKLLDPFVEEIPVETIHHFAEWADAIIMPFTAQHKDAISEFMTRFSHKFRILGGALAKYLQQELFEDKIVDCIITGEPEATVLEIINRFPVINRIPGTISMGGDGRLEDCPPGPLRDDIDAIPHPYRDYTAPENYWNILFFGQPTASILCARGCPHNCIFCASKNLYGNRLRRRCPADVVAEIEEIVNTFGVRYFDLFDDTFYLDSRYVLDVCGEIRKRNLQIFWKCDARSEHLERAVLQEMKECGCQYVCIGLESTSDEILKYYRKGTTFDKIDKGIRMVKDSGMNLVLYCIFGAPMETRETMQKTLAYVRKVSPFFVSFNILTPLPGSELFEEHQSRIDLKGEMNKLDILHCEHQLGDLSSQQLFSAVKRAYRKHYLNPRFFYKIFRHFIKFPEQRLSMLKFIPIQGWYVVRSILFYSGRS